MLDRLEFILSEAVTALRRNKWMTFSAITTVAMALFILGGLFYILRQANMQLAKAQDEYSLRVFTQIGTTDNELQAARSKLTAVEGVDRVEYISSEKGIELFAQENPDVPVEDLLNDPTVDISEIVPDSFNVFLKDVNESQAIAAEIAIMPFVMQDGVREANEYRDFLKGIISTMQILGFVLGGVMLVTGGILINNAIRLTILARSREMRIMHLVGAAPSTVNSPLIVEGLVQGTLGGLGAGLVLYATIIGVQQLVRGYTFQGTLEGPGVGTIVPLILAGAAYGIVCSWLAVRRTHE